MESAQIIAVTLKTGGPTPFFPENSVGACTLQEKKLQRRAFATADVVFSRLECRQNKIVESAFSKFVLWR